MPTFCILELSFTAVTKWYYQSWRWSLNFTFYWLYFKIYFEFFVPSSSSRQLKCFLLVAWSCFLKEKNQPKTSNNKNPQQTNKILHPQIPTELNFKILKSSMFSSIKVLTCLGRKWTKGSGVLTVLTLNKPSYSEYPSALSGIHGKYAKYVFSVIFYYHFLHAVQEVFSHKKGLALLL